MSSRWRSSPKAKREVTLGFVRDGKPGQVTVVPDGQGKYEMGDIGIRPIVHPEVVESARAQPAAEAGLQKGDVILGRRRRAERHATSS